MISAASCSGSGLVRIVYENGLYVDKTNNIKYRDASVSYEPAEIGDEYGKFEDDLILHKITGADPKEWITEAFEGIGAVYYSEAVTLPALENFGANKIYICISGLKTIGIGTIEETDIVNELIQTIQTGEQRETNDAADSYYLKFVSETYPFLYYNVMYIKTVTGEHLLYDRGTKRCVAVGDIIEKYLPDTPEDSNV